MTKAEFRAKVLTVVCDLIDDSRFEDEVFKVLEKQGYVPNQENDDQIEDILAEVSGVVSDL